MIEDDKDTAFVYASALEAEGFEVFVSRNGEEGVNKALEIQPAVILVDLVLPPSDESFPDYARFRGLDVLKKLKENGRTAHIPVIVLSNIELADVHTDAIKLGAARVLSKTDLPAHQLPSIVTEFIR